jgi:hypothetical protein
LLALTTAAASFPPLPYAYWAGTANSLASASVVEVTVNFGLPPFWFGRPVGHSKPTILVFLERETCSFKCFEFAQITGWPYLPAKSQVKLSLLPANRIRQSWGQAN